MEEVMGGVEMIAHIKEGRRRLLGFKGRGNNDS